MSLGTLKNQPWFKELETENPITHTPNYSVDTKPPKDVWKSITGENQMLPVPVEPFSLPINIVELGGGDKPVFHPNIDIRALPTVDIVRNLEEDFSDIGKWDAIYASYVAEHISWTKIKTFFKSCYNILNDNGIALFIVPNTFEQIEKVVKAGRITLDDSSTVFGGTGVPYNEHKVLFGPKFIKDLLYEAGFQKVEVYDHPATDFWDMIVKAYKWGEDKIESGDFDGVKLFYRGRVGGETPDLSIIRDLYDREGYSKNVFNLPTGAVVIDIGAHIGVYAIKVKHKRPDLKMYAVEPHPGNLELLRKNIDENNMDITVLPYAISNISGPKNMWVHNYNHGSNTLVKDQVNLYPDEYDKQMEVNCITMDELFTIINEPYIDHIKMDIQGEENIIIKDLVNRGGVLDRIGSIDIEFHRMENEYQCSHDIVSALAGLGFTVEQTGRNTAYFSHPLVKGSDGSDRSDCSDISGPKINFGSFTVTFGHDWINADIRGDIKDYVESKGHRFMELDVRNRLPWEDNSVAYITHHHLLEHLTDEEGKGFLKDCYRILKPSGVMRLSVPDPQKLARLYAENGMSSLSDESDEVKNAKYSVDRFWTLLTSGHKTMYDMVKLKDVLDNTGFTNIMFMGYKQSNHDIFVNETTELFPKHSLFVEATKPTTFETPQKTKIPSTYKEYLEA